MKTEGGLFVGDITQGLPRPRDWQDDGGTTKAPQQQQSAAPVYDDDEEGDYTARYGYASHLAGHRVPS